METKKQLIIIPPMSEALKKLNEVLEGISADENMEISIIDDLKELAQFLGTTGQCIILASNAKKCATFLQENKSILAKHHCKTILFTPKEIPMKTLTKFTKIGLTESILESLPPKTFLYKVKLLLRSIKTAKPQDDGDKLVKSLEAKAQEEAEKEVKEKKKQEENVLDLGLGKKKNNDSDESIDYGNPLKGKVKKVDENLDTHWKSDRKKDPNAETQEEEDMSVDSAPDSIDMYYRGKKKRSEEALPMAEAELEKIKLENVEQEATEKKKRNYEDAIDEGSMKSKRLDQRPEEEVAPADKPLNVELDLIAAKKKRSEKEDVVDDLGRGLKPIPMEEDSSPEKESTIENENADLGGYLKGKVSRIQEEAESTPDVEETKQYDNSEKDEKENSDIDLDLLDGDKKSKKKEDIAPEEDSKAHDGTVDHMEGNMTGDSGTVEKIRTRMMGESTSKEKKEEKEDFDDFFAKMEKLAEDQERAQEQGLDLLPAAKKELERAQLRKEADDDLEESEQHAELDLIAAQKKKDNAVTKQEEETQRENGQPTLANPEASERERQKSQMPEEKELGLRSMEPDLEKKSKNRTHDSNVDKIDTFYRGGDSSKKKEQNWDNLTDRNTSLDITPGKSKRADGGTQKADDKNQGEITIDYKKLKQEFEMMSGGINPDGTLRSFAINDTTLRNNDDEGSFKVVEIDPKSLDFSITLLNAIYQKDVKPKQMFAMMAMELIKNYRCTPVFYTYKLSEKKFIDAYNPFVELSGDIMPSSKKDWWNEFKKDTDTMEHFQSHSMSTWRCTEMSWEDVELPAWAEQELKNKSVELVFPYFDGIDRMGMAVVFFPEGLNPKDAMGILTVLEMARTMFLDTIQRYQVQPIKEELKLVDTSTEKEVSVPKKGLMGMVSGLFGKKKAG